MAIIATPIRTLGIVVLALASSASLSSAASAQQNGALKTIAPKKIAPKTSAPKNDGAETKPYSVECRFRGDYVERNGMGEEAPARTKSGNARLYISTGGASITSDSVDVSSEALSGWGSTYSLERYEESSNGSTSTYVTMDVDIKAMTISVVEQIDQQWRLVQGTRLSGNWGSEWYADGDCVRDVQ